MANKPSKEDLLEAVKELQEEEQLPLFSEAQVHVFNSEYVKGYDQAMSVLDEKVEAHKKTKRGKNQSF